MMLRSKDLKAINEKGNTINNQRGGRILSFIKVILHDHGY